MKNFVEVTNNQIKALTRGSIHKVTTNECAREAFINSIEAACDNKLNNLFFRVRPNPIIKEVLKTDNFPNVKGELRCLEFIDNSGGMTRDELRKRMGISVDPNSTRLTNVDNHGVGIKSNLILMGGGLIATWSKDSNFTLIYLGPTEEGSYKIIEIDEDFLFKGNHDEESYSILINILYEYQDLSIGNLDSDDKTTKSSIDFNQGATSVIVLGNLLTLSEEGFKINYDFDNNVRQIAPGSKGLVIGTIESTLNFLKWKINNINGYLLNGHSFESIDAKCVSGTSSDRNIPGLNVKLEEKVLDKSINRVIHSKSFNVPLKYSQEEINTWGNPPSISLRASIYYSSTYSFDGGTYRGVCMNYKNKDNFIFLADRKDQSPKFHTTLLLNTFNRKEKLSRIMRDRFAIILYLENEKFDGLEIDVDTMRKEIKVSSTKGKFINSLNLDSTLNLEVLGDILHRLIFNDSYIAKDIKDIEEELSKEVNKDLVYKAVVRNYYTKKIRKVKTSKNSAKSDKLELEDEDTKFPGTRKHNYPKKRKKRTTKLSVKDITTIIEDTSVGDNPSGNTSVSTTEGNKSIVTIYDKLEGVKGSTNSIRVELVEDFESVLSCEEIINNESVEVKPTFLMFPTDSNDNICYVNSNHTIYKECTTFLKEKYSSYNSSQLQTLVNSFIIYCLVKEISHIQDVYEISYRSTPGKTPVEVINNSIDDFYRSLGKNFYSCLDTCVTYEELTKHHKRLAKEIV